MKSYTNSQIRNVALLAHSGVGKTTLLERLLYDNKVTSRMGRVEDGNTVSDFMPEEVAKKVTISTSLIPLEWNDYKINFLDTPGYSDFIGEVDSVIPVIDGAVFLVCGVAGVEVQTEIIWERAHKYSLPAMVLINKLERENASYEKVFDQITERLPGRFAPLTIPIGKEHGFCGVVDILLLKAYKYEQGKVTEIPIPEDMQEEVEVFRNILVETAVETDEELMTKYLDEQELTQEELINGFKTAVMEGLTPVLAGSAGAGIGIDVFLDKLVKNIPAPEQKVGKLPKGAFVGRVFKTLVDPYLGRLNFVKVMAGELSPTTPLINITRCSQEKLGQLMFLRGKQQIATERVFMGDIVVIPKLAYTCTGDTLASHQDIPAFEPICFVKPNYQLAVFPKTKNDEDKMGTAIARLLEEDMTLQIFKDHETHETVFAGMGEQHLEITIDKLRRRYGVEVTTATPRVPFRETIRKPVKVEGKHKKQSGGHGQYGHVWLEFTPSTNEFEFAETIFGGAVPKQYIPAVEKGIKEAMQGGVLAGYPMTGIKAVLTDGSYHTVDSSELAFKIAAIQAFKKGLLQANPVLLEPIMNVEIVVPDQYTGDIISDINSRRGRVMGMDPVQGRTLIKAFVPLVEMQKYAIDLRSMTQGRGSFSMNFANYEEAPPKLSEEVKANFKTS